MAEQVSPTGQVIPNVYVEAVEPLREFYLERLGFSHRMGIVGKDGALDMAIVEREGAMVMMARPQADNPAARRAATPRALDLYVCVADVDRYHRDVTGRGLRATQPLADQWWGHRSFAVEDPYGYTLWFFQDLGGMNPPPGVTLV